MLNKLLPKLTEFSPEAGEAEKFHVCVTQLPAATAEVKLLQSCQKALCLETGSLCCRVYYYVNRVTVQPFKSFCQRVTLCLPKGRLLLCLPAQSVQ